MTEYAVRWADLDRDRDAIVALWSRNLHSYDAGAHAAKYDWYYRNNPLGTGLLSVIEANPGGAIVGVLGMGWRRIKLRDSVVLTGLTSDFAVDREHRALGPAMMLQRSMLSVMPERVGLIYGLPNAKALPIYKVLRYNTDASLMRYVKVLATERYLSRVPGPRIVRKIAAGVLDPLLRLASRETWRLRRGRVMRELPEFDTRFDELWSRTASAFDVTYERKSAFLRWRFGTCPITTYVTLGLVDPKSDTLLGYAICTRGADEQVSVIDFWCGADESTRDDLLAGLLRWARANGAASVACEVGGIKHLADALVRFGFRHRGKGSAIVVSQAQNGTPEAKLDAWYFLQADEDYN